MRGEFTVSIRLGNAAMDNAFAVAQAVRKIAQQIDDDGLEYFRQAPSILDWNGQTVGVAEFAKEEE